MGFNISPTVRITIGVLSLTLSLILVADFIGMTPDGERNVIEQRQRFVEMLTVQLSVAVEKKNARAMKSLLWTAVQRNKEIVSAAIRRPDGVIFVQYGEHEKNWENFAGNNTSTEMQLPIMQKNKTYAQVEVLFHPIGEVGIFGIPIGTLSGLLIFVVLIGSFGYWILIRRSLMYLDPTSVIPGRVRSALDVLASGVLILDEKERIVMSNAVFSNKVRIPAGQLIGMRPSEFPWRSPRDDESSVDLPWQDALKSGLDRANVMLRLTVGESSERVFLVNSSPIIDENDKLRGVMVGFDDVSDLEAKNRMLHDMVQELEQSKDKVDKQNEKLHYLATRDPLTGCHNRRSLYEQFESTMKHSMAQNKPLSCIMSDIDHFKAVNDTYGHGAGDEIIKMVTKALREAVREEDVVGRYGGEEFCIMLPGISVFEAKKIAERCRKSIESESCENIKVTSSFGVSSLSGGAKTVDEMISQADAALYLSKENGRNRVTGWKRSVNKEEIDSVVGE